MTPHRHPHSPANAGLIGRADELARLQEAAGALARGDGGRAFWLDGAPGVGKTRLVDAFAGEVTLAVAAGSCRPNGQTPFGPFVAALAPHLPTLLQGPAGERLGPLLARVWPGCWPDAVPALEPEREGMRLRLALVEAITTLARIHGGLLLVLEDWHWADPLSDELAGGLVRRAHELPLLLVVTARPPIAGLPAWAAGATLLRLPPLDETGIAALVARRLGMAASEAPAPELVASVCAFSGGNPLLAEQFVAQARAPGSRAPESVADLVTARLAPSNPITRELAGLLAILGGVVALPLLVRACGQDEATVRAALDGLAAGQLVVATPAGYRLAHERIADALLAWVPAEDRVRWHAAAARALVADDAAGPTRRTTELVTTVASHAVAGGLAPGSEDEGAIAYALEAGHRCAALYANEAAEHFLVAGLAALRLDGRAALRHERLGALQALGDVRRVTGRYEAAREAYDEAMRLAEALEDGPRLARLATSLAKVHQGLDDLAGAIRHAERALEVGTGVGAPAEAARASLTLARLRYYQGDTTAARSETARSLALAREANDPVRTAEALAFSGHLSLALAGADDTSGLAALHESIALLSTMGDQAGLAQSYMLLGDAQAARGDLIGARKSFNLARWICEEVGNRTDAGIAALNLATAALELGEPTEALALATAAGEAARALPNRFQAAVADVVAVAARVALGAVAGQHEALAHAVAAARALENRYLEAVVLPIAAETWLALGRLDAAREAAHALQPLLADGAPGQARLDALLAEVLGRLGESAAAAEHGARAARALGIATSPVERAFVERVLGWLANARGDHAEAARARATAAQLAARAGLRMLEIEVALPLDGGDPGAPAEAAARLREVAAAAREAGARVLEARAWGAVAALDPDRPRAAEAEAAARALSRAVLLDGTAEECQAFGAIAERRWMIDTEGLLAVASARMIEPDPSGEASRGGTAERGGAA